MTADRDSNPNKSPIPIEGPWLRLAKYLIGDLRRSDQTEIERWIEGETHRPVIIARLRRIWARPTRTDSVDVEAHLTTAIRRLKLNTTSGNQAIAQTRIKPGVKPRGASLGTQILRVSTVGAITVAVGVVITLGFKKSPTERAAHTYTTRAGQLAMVRLDDGTSITLAPRTTLVVPRGFGTTDRAVSLTGQAYFDVASANGHPFIVRTGTVTSRVLGTRFTVRHYEDDQDVLVAVQSGKVAAGRDVPVVLSERMLGRITDSTPVVTADADLHEYLEWTTGHLVFAEVPIDEVTKVLGRWYGLTFKFADSSAIHERVSGILDAHDSQQDVLQNLQIILGMRMTFQGRVVTLSPRTHLPLSRPLPGSRDNKTASHSEVGR